MSRDTSTNFNTAAEAQTIYPALLGELEFSSGFIYVWTGYGDLVYDSKTYIGVGALAGVSPVSETGSVVANGITFTLNGIPAEYISLVLSEARKARDARFHIALFDSSGTLIDVAEDCFKGYMDVPIIQKGGSTSSITITAESRLIELQKAKIRRRTHEDQQELYPGDLGLEYVASLQDKKIY